MTIGTITPTSRHLGPPWRMIQEGAASGVALSAQGTAAFPRQLLGAPSVLPPPAPKSSKGPAPGPVRTLELVRAKYDKVLGIDPLKQTFICDCFFEFKIRGGAKDEVRVELCCCLAHHPSCRLPDRLT